jgi:AraC family transcriptional regulator of adaptative response/methylated-DNA-[protein]-cysteine methyltransferase
MTALRLTDRAPRAALPATRDRELVEAACRHLDDADDRVPTLHELARTLRASPDSLRGAFRRLLGVTPRQYADARRRERLRRGLAAGRDVTGALFEAGYGSTSRLYESAHHHLGMTPGSYRAGGAGATIAYTVVDSPLGRLLVAATDRGVCMISLGDTDAEVEGRLRRELHAAVLQRDDDGLRSAVAGVLPLVEGVVPASELPLDVRGTAFQRRVWEALRRIPRGETRTYGEVAAAIGAPRAARAVGAACATNPVALVVPCHRVVPASGGVGNYALGPQRKRELLRLEGAAVASSED